MTLAEYLESIGYSEYDISMTLLYYEYGVEMPEEVSKEGMYWINHVEH